MLQSQRDIFAAAQVIKFLRNENHLKSDNVEHTTFDNSFV